MVPKRPSLVQQARQMQFATWKREHEELCYGLLSHPNVVQMQKCNKQTKKIAGPANEYALVVVRHEAKELIPSV